MLYIPLDEFEVGTKVRGVIDLILEQLVDLLASALANEERN